MSVLIIVGLVALVVIVLAAAALVAVEQLWPD